MNLCRPQGFPSSNDQLIGYPHIPHRDQPYGASNYKPGRMRVYTFGENHSTFFQKQLQQESGRGSEHDRALQRRKKTFSLNGDYFPDWRLKPTALIQGFSGYFSHKLQRHGGVLNEWSAKEPAFDRYSGTTENDDGASQCNPRSRERPAKGTPIPNPRSSYVRSQFMVSTDRTVYPF